MTALYLYRAHDYDSPEEAEKDGALYDVPLQASTDVGITSVFFRDFIDDIPSIIAMAGKVMDSSADLTVVMKHPENGEFMSTDDFIEWSCTKQG